MLRREVSIEDDPELIAIDFNLLVGVIVVFAVGAYILVLRKIRAHPTNPDSTSSIETDLKIPEETKETTKAPEPSIADELPTEKPTIKCHHHFGYLGSLARKSETPEECLQCRRIVRCKNRKKLKRAKTKRAATVLATSPEQSEITTQP